VTNLSLGAPAGAAILLAESNNLKSLPNANGCREAGYYAA
jgi:hypothetical protein